MSEIKILFLGEIVGKAGVYCVKTLIQRLRDEIKPDFIIANGEGATGGFGIGKTHAVYLKKLGVDVITSGERIYYKKDMVPFIEKASFILKPVNYPRGTPGFGWRMFSKENKHIVVINVLGMSGFRRVHLANPFLVLRDLVERLAVDRTKNIIVDFHASATAEKSTMFYMLDGKVSAVIGTHTRVPTADERVMPNGTAVITDVGRVGSIDSVCGLETETEIRKFKTQIHEYSKDAWGNLELNGVVFSIEEDGLSTGIERIKMDIPVETSKVNNKNSAVAK